MMGEMEPEYILGSRLDDGESPGYHPSELTAQDAMAEWLRRVTRISVITYHMGSPAQVRVLLASHTVV
jgi:hypothetical protein